jgi:ketosteroid isomerase-like protein
MPDTPITTTIRRYFAAYAAKDRALIESLLTSDFHFSSPQDDRIDRATYFDRCWPFSEHVSTFHLEKIFEDGNEAFLTYTCQPGEGPGFRNTEFFRFRDGLIDEVTVYFGRSLRGPVSEAVPQTEDSTEEAVLRHLIESRIEAVRSLNVDDAIANVAPDALIFDVVDPLQSFGRKTFRDRATEWFGTFDGPIGFEIRDLRIVASPTVAFSYGLNHVDATRRDGKKLKMWWRSTVCYRRIEGRWLIVQEHNSVPFDVSTGMASLGLEP